MKTGEEATFIKQTLGIKKEAVKLEMQRNMKQRKKLEKLITSIRESSNVTPADYEHLLESRDSTFIEDVLCMRLNGNWQLYTIYCTKKEYKTLIRWLQFLRVANLFIYSAIFLLRIRLLQIFCDITGE